MQICHKYFQKNICFAYGRSCLCVCVLVTLCVARNFFVNLDASTDSAPQYIDTAPQYIHLHMK